MIIRDVKETSSTTTEQHADLFLSGYSSDSIEVMWDKNHVIYRNILKKLYVRFYNLSTNLNLSNLILYSKFWGGDYLRTPSITTIQKLVAAAVDNDESELSYQGNRVAVKNLLEEQFCFSSKFVFRSIFVFLRKIIAGGIKYFRNYSKPSYDLYSNVVYTIPSAITEYDSHLECRYWGEELHQVLNINDSCVFLKGFKTKKKLSHRMIHEFDTLPYYLFPKFVYLCILDFFCRHRNIFILSNERKKLEVHNWGEDLFRRYCLMSLASDVVEDTVTHVVYRMAGEVLGRRIKKTGRIYLLSENQAWERSLQAGLSDSGFCGSVVHFYHGGIKPNECRYDLHQNLLDWGRYSQKNIFVATTGSVACFSAQLDFKVANRKLERTCRELCDARSTDKLSYGILVFGDISVEVTTQMLQAVFTHKDELSADFVGVRWHPSWSATDILRCREALKEHGVERLVDAQGHRFEWSVSSCFSTASLDSRHLGLRIGIFSKPEWLNTSPLQLKQVEKIIFPDYVISNPDNIDHSQRNDVISPVIGSDGEVTWCDIIKFKG